MAGYTRADVSNNIANGNNIDATYLDLEFDAVEAAFNVSTGHTHDGTSGEGVPITKFGPAQEYLGSGASFNPKTDDTYELGTTSLRWSNAWVEGTITTGVVISDAASSFQALNTDTASLPGFTWDNDLNTGMFRPATDTIAFSTASTERMRISSAGAVTIPGTLAVTGTVSGGVITGSSFVGNASASSLNSGTVPDARLNTSYSNLVSITGSGTSTFTAVKSAGGGTVASPNFSFITNTAHGLHHSSGGDTLDLVHGGTARLSISAAAITAVGSAVFTGDGSGLTTLSATNLSSGTLPVARLGTSSSENLWVNARIAAQTQADVGTLSFLKNISGSSMARGSSQDGADLRYSDTSASSGSTVTGTWQAMSSCANNAATLFLRTA